MNYKKKQQHQSTKFVTEPWSKPLRKSAIFDQNRHFVTFTYVVFEQSRLQAFYLQNSKEDSFNALEIKSCYKVFSASNDVGVV